MNFCAASITFHFSEIIDQFIPQRNLSAILNKCITLFFFVSFFFIFYVLSLKYSKLAQYNMQHNIRTAIYHSLNTCQYEEFSINSYGKVNTGIIQEVEAFCDILFTKVFNSLSSILFFIMSYYFLLKTNATLTLMLLTYMAATAIYIYALKRVMIHHTETYVSSRTTMNEYIKDFIIHRKSILIYNVTNVYISKIHDKNETVNKAWLKTNVFTPLIQSSIELSILISYLITFYISWNNIKMGHSTYADLFLFLTYMPQLWGKYNSVIDIYTELSKANVYAKRIANAINTNTVCEQNTSYRIEREIIKNSQSVSSHGITIYQLTFSFSNQLPLWHCFSADFSEYGIYGLQGPSGCGKSTLFDILTGLYIPQSGSIQICSKPLNDYKLTELHSKVGIIHQEAFIISGTIISNIQYYNNQITEQMIYECIHKYSLEKAFEPLQTKWWNNLVYDDPALTFGQKRLISLIRVLVRNPEILLCDEITAGLDSHTEEIMLSVIIMYSISHTCLLISHKESDMNIAKRIIQI